MDYVKLMDKRYLGPQNTFPLTPTKEEPEKWIKKLPEEKRSNMSSNDNFPGQQ